VLLAKIKELKNTVLVCLAVFLMMASTAFSLEQNNVTEPIMLSVQLPDFNKAYKPKLVRTGNGLLVVVYGDAVNNLPDNYVYDLKNDIERPARDVFIRSCDAMLFDCSQSTNWSSPINISATALLSSTNSDINGDGVRTPYFGDSDNPHIFASGSLVAVTWGDKYCPGGSQRTTTYLERNSREIPMSCLYVAHATGNIADIANWTIDRLSDGSRDVKNDVSRGLKSGAWVVTWQEDPLGLQPGEAEGPGEGSSGAKVSHGTDIWYSYSSNISNATGDIGVWVTPVRITDNQTGYGLQGSFNPIKDVNGNPVSPALIEKGSAGASRANLGLVGGSSPPKAIVAYEETKASSGLDEGKFLRYHNFNYNNPPTDLVCNPLDYDNCRVGCVISTPSENARRARFVTQTNPGTNSGIRWAVLWRQGTYTEGGPADVMMRLGFTDFNGANLQPGLDYPACFAADYASAINLTNNEPLNISSNTPVATSSNLTNTTSSNPFENSRAHRAVLRGDYLNVGYIYTPDWAVAEATDLENYNFYVRHYDATTAVWNSPVNLSQITDTSINVKEPRLLGPPGNGPDCVDPQAPVDERDCQDKQVIVAAWGTETNVYAHIGGAEHLDLFITRSTDQTSTFEPVIMLAGGPDSQGESQLRITPDGTEIYAVWSQTTGGMVTDAMYAQLTNQAIPPSQSQPPQLTDEDNDLLFGCSYNPNAEFDPLLPLLIFISVFYLFVRNRKNSLQNKPKTEISCKQIFIQMYVMRR
jgi:hypothetical protein